MFDIVKFTNTQIYTHEHKIYNLAVKQWKLLGIRTISLSYSEGSMQEDTNHGDCIFVPEKT